MLCSRFPSAAYKGLFNTLDSIYVTRLLHRIMVRMYSQAPLLVLTMLLLLDCTWAKKHIFVLVSDLHYDPHYGTINSSGTPCRSASSAKGVLGCDSPWPLLESLINDIIGATPDDAHLLFTGDWLRHDIDKNDAVWAFGKVSALLTRVAGRGSPVIAAPSLVSAALGNNDFVPDHYLDVSNKTQPLMQAYADLMKTASLLSDAEATAFGEAGYYSRDLVTPNLRVIVINTELYHPSLTPEINPVLNPDPLGQFAFLSSKLEEASKQGIPTVIIGHVPPTMNAFYCVRGDYRSYIKEEFLSRYLAIVNKFSSTIVYQFFGHAHQLSFLADKKAGVPGVIVPGVSPIFGNAPNYLLAEYDNETKTFGSFRMRHMTLDSGEWSYFSVLGQESIDSLIGSTSTISDAVATATNLISDSSAWGTYLVLHAGGQTANMWPGVDPINIRQRHVCAMLQFTRSDYMQCIDRPLSGAASRKVSGGVIAVCVISFLMGLGGMLYAYMHLRQPSSRDTALKLEPDTEMSSP